MEIALALVLLAQVQGNWVDFEICRVRNAVSKATGEFLSAWITNERAPAILDVFPRPKGVSCVQLIYQGNSVYVVGSREEVKAMIERKK